MTDKLKPCPLCGGKDIRKITTVADCTIHCQNCKAKISRFLFCGKYDTLKEAEEDLGREATNAWNRRADNER